MRLNEAENQSKRGLFSSAFSGRVAVNNSGGGSCAGVFFQMTWLVNFSDLHKHVPSGHA